MELYIARHGETEFNVQRRWQGSGQDSPLTQKGIRQAAELGTKLEGISFDAIYSSPLKRAMDTTRIAFKNENLFENGAFTDSRLVEVGLGDAEGKTNEEMLEKYQAFNFETLGNNPSAYIPPPKGEALTDMIARIDSFLQELATKPYKRVFVLTHGYALRVVYACSQDKSLDAIAQAPFYDNCALLQYTFKGGKWNPA